MYLSQNSLPTRFFVICLLLVVSCTKKEETIWTLPIKNISNTNTQPHIKLSRSEFEAHLSELLHRNPTIKAKFLNVNLWLDSLVKTREFQNIRQINNSEKRLKEINRILFRSHNITYDSTLNEWQGLDPRQIWTKRRGSCLGITTLAYLISKRLETYIIPVSLKHHIFYRYQDSLKQINFEPNRGGYEYTNEEYQAKYQNFPGQTFNPLSTGEFLGLLYFNVGNYYLHHEQYKQAMYLYQKSLEAGLNTEFNRGNLALSLLKIGKLDTAMLILSDLEKDFPHSEQVKKNRAQLKLLMK